MARPGKPLIRALNGEVVRPIPFWLMRQAGRYLPEYRALRERSGSFLDLCYSPDRAAEATLQPVRRFGMDAAILFSDILLVPQALGQAVSFEAGEGPRLEPIRGRSGVAALDAAKVCEKLSAVYEAMHRVKAALPSQTTLIGFAGAPWTVATYMVEGGASRDFAVVQRWAASDAAAFDALIEKLIEATGRHLAAQIDAGAEAVQLFDTWAGIVPEEAFERLVAMPTRRIVEYLHGTHPRIPVIGFPRGIGTRYRRYFAATGVDALSIDAAITPAAAARDLQPLGPIQGNLDPQLLLAGGPALAEAVERILAALDAGPFVFNLGHGVLPQTPVEHIARLTQMIRAHG